MSSLPLGRRSLGKFALVFSLYLSQGVATTFLVLGVPSVLRKYGMPLNLLWVAYLPVMLYSIKFLWAPLADRHWFPSIGRRRSWLIPATLCLGLSFLILSRVSPQQSVTGAAVAFFLIALSGANMDIATDAYTVELLEPAERGLGNGLQSAGLACGGLVGRGLSLVMIERLGWSAALALIGFLIPVIAAPGLLRREGPPPAAVDTRVRPASLGGFFRRPETPFTLLLALLTGLVHFMLGPIVGPFLVDAGLSLAQVGALQGVLGTGAGIVGALMAGASVNWLGFRRAYLVTVGMALAVALLAAALASAHVTALLPLALMVGAVNFAMSAIFAVFYANVMNWCSPAQVATDFTAISSMFSLMAVLGATGAAFMAHRFGYGAHFMLVAGVAGIALIAVARLSTRVAAATARLTTSSG